MPPRAKYTRSPPRFRPDANAPHYKKFKQAMDENELYDDFGQYIGPERPDDDVEPDSAAVTGEAMAEDPADPDNEPMMDVDETPSNAVILHEDKQYYPSAQQVYGQDVETLVQEEDTQSLAQPIVEPVKEKKFNIQEDGLPPVHYTREFMAGLMDYPDQVRNVAIAGHFKHGKTALMDMLVMQTHDIRDRVNKRRNTGRKDGDQLRYTDISYVERERGISVKSSPMSLLLESSKGKSHPFHIIDTPGHVEFADEVAAGMRISDGVVLVVDVVEGVQLGTEQIIRHAVLQDLPMVLVINKMDRLILDLHIPPTDAYFKLKRVVEEVNTVVEKTIPGRSVTHRISPERGNVAFACASMEWIFTLPSFAKMYDSFYPGSGIDLDGFVKRMWGDVFYNKQTRKYSPKPQGEASERSFVHWVMDPVYKLYTHTLSRDPNSLKKFLEKWGMKLKLSELKLDPDELLKKVCAQFFGGYGPLVDMVVQHIPSPVDGAQRLLDQFYTGESESAAYKGMQKADRDGPLVVHVSKLYPMPNAVDFYALGRVLSGTARQGQSVRVLGESYTSADEEDMAEAEMTATMLPGARYNVDTAAVPAGNWVLMSGVDNQIVKTATIVGSSKEVKEEVYVFKPIRHFFESVFKIAVEPQKPSELPKMLEGLRRVNKSYPLIDTKVEDSGEHVIIGTGELYMDCMLHDLRKLYTEMDIRLSDPMVRFCETCTETSAVKCYASTPNKKNTLTFLAEPLEKGISTDIEQHSIDLKQPARVVGKFFEDNYGWDILAGRNIWAFGPQEDSPNMLVNDTLPSQTDAKLLRSIREHTRQGFAWATREGPLCEEPIRNVKFRLTDVILADNALARGGGQIIPTARRACYSSFLLGSPRIMEPMYQASVVLKDGNHSSTENVLNRRRGHVVANEPVPGTPLYRVTGLVPVIDSFGIEADIRIAAQGMAAVSLVFDRWQTVPGDPLDLSVKVPKLQSGSGVELARDFVVKTRRRKGLKEAVSVSRYLEGDIIEELRASGALPGE